METISVVLHEDVSFRLFWQALAHALRKDSRLNVTELESVSEILPTLQGCDVDLLICGSAVKISDRQLFRDYPGLTIIRVNEENAKTVVRTSQSIPVDTRIQFDDPDCTGFLKLVNQLFPPTCSESDHSGKPSLQLLKATEDVDSEMGQDTHRVRKLRPFSEKDELTFFESAGRWLETMLIERLAVLLKDDGDAQARVTGWGLSTRDACHLLGADPDSIHVEAIRAERMILDQSLFDVDQGDAMNRFNWLSLVFGLDEIQQRLLLLSIAPEIDGRIARVYGSLNDDMTRRWLTQSLLADLPGLSDVSPRRLLKELCGNSPLRFFDLLSLDESFALPSSDLAIRVAGDVRRFLSSGELDSEFETFQVFPAAASENLGRSTHGLRTRLDRWLCEREDEGQAAILNLDACSDGQRWFIRGATEMGLGVVRIDLCQLAGNSPPDVRHALLNAVRTAMLAESAVLLTDLSAVPEDISRSIQTLALEVLTTRAPLLVIEGRFSDVGAVRSIARLSRDPLDSGDRAAVWLDYADRLDISLDQRQAQELGTWTKFNEADIEQTLFFCRDKIMDVHQFRHAARHVSSAGIPSSVRRLPAQLDWDDIVLPPQVKEMLRRIPNHIAYREKVLTDWGYRERMGYGLGTACLFSGPSGTGKTMASQIIAQAIGESEIFQCDLAKTVSKYIGETEKNLDEIFEAAEKARAVLVFNEADVLFGKRTEIRDAHDRYANLEVGYLLQRMESFEGLVILTTNSRSSMDVAFLRRLRFIVEFPVPNAGDREKIWQRVFPRELKRADDVSFGYLAQQLNLNGGHIQQIAILAAYAAAAEGCDKLHMRHVIAATRDELAKLGMGSAQQVLDEVAA